MKMNRAKQRRRREDIAQRVREGVPPAKVARNFRVSLSQVYVAMDEHEVPAPIRRTKAIGRQLEILAHIYHGTTVQQTAKKLNVTRQRVENVVKEANLYGLLTPTQLIQLWQDMRTALPGVSLRQIGEQHHLSPEQTRGLYELAKNAGLNVGHWGQT